jgi:MFS family permease
VLAPYADLLRRPGTLRFSAAGFVQRLPMSMLGLGTVLFLTLRGESYAVAGAVSATGAITNAVLGPFLSRYIDRLGQHVVLPIIVAAALTFQITFISLVLLGAPVWTWFVAFGLGEGFVPNVGSIIRARWAYVLDVPRDVNTAFAFESVVDEIVFIAGPPVATLLAVGVVSWGSVGAAILLLALGTLLLLPQRSTEPPPAGPEHHEGRAAVRYPGVWLVFGVFLAVGAVFGSYEVVTVAFAAEQGDRQWTGLLLAVYALGSGVAGLVLGTLHLRASLVVQFRTYLIALALIGLPFPFVGSTPVLGLLSFVAGLTVAPTLITGMALTERLVPPQRLTEGLTVVMAGLTVGFAGGTSISGPIIDAHGASTAYWVFTSAAAVGALLTLAGSRHLGRALTAAETATAAGRPVGEPAPES